MKVFGELLSLNAVKARRVSAVCAVCFFMLLNAAGFSFEKRALSFNSPSDNELGRITSTLNAPLKFFKELFSQSWAFSKKTQEERGIKSAALALPAQARSAKKAVKGVLSSDLRLEKNLSQQFFAWGGGAFDLPVCALGGGIIFEAFKFLFIFLILFSVLPRGRPENHIINMQKNNKSSALPARKTLRSGFSVYNGGESLADGRLK